jgi:ribose/xylose/arabinose/galactoside ABC-type transport system permease subunit
MPEPVEGNAPATLTQRLKQLPSICFAIAALVAFIALFSIGNPAFFGLYNFNIIVLSAVILVAVGIGQSWPIVTGGIDLSVGGVMSLVSVVFITTVGSLGYWSYPLCLLIGIAIGYVNGNLLSRVKIPSFIATLGTGGILVSLSYIISPQALNVPMKQMAILNVVNGNWLGIPNTFVIGALYFLAFYCVQRFTVTGRSIFYVGSNVGMSWLSGVNIVRVKNMAFVFSGFGAATAGLILASRQYSGYPTIGAVYILSSIATVVLGGTAMTGGSGGVLNTLIGALIMGVLQNGMTVVGVDVYAQQSLLGALIILCVWISFDRSKVEIVK